MTFDVSGAKDSGAKDSGAKDSGAKDIASMDPRRIELNRKHSREMGVLFAQFLDAHPDVESEVHGAEMTPEQDAAWTAFSAELLARHQAERSALAAEIEAEKRQS